MGRGSRRRTFSRSRSHPRAEPGICRVASNAAPWSWHKPSPPGRASTFRADRARQGHAFAPHAFVPHAFVPHAFVPHAFVPHAFAPHAFAPHGEPPRHALCRAMPAE